MIPQDRREPTLTAFREALNKHHEKLGVPKIDIEEQVKRLDKSFSSGLKMVDNRIRSRLHPYDAETLNALYGN